MDAAEVDNSGTIDYDEFIAATVHMSKLESRNTCSRPSPTSTRTTAATSPSTSWSRLLACREHNMANVGLNDIIIEVSHSSPLISASSSLGLWLISRRT
jgi:calcium-dependent protein kinase